MLKEKEDMKKDMDNKKTVGMVGIGASVVSIVALCVLIFR